MNIDLPIRAKGRFKIIKHTGHKFDDTGNVVEWGRVLDETPFGDNVFTYYGSAFILNNGANTLSMSVSSSAIPPSTNGVAPNSEAVVRTSTTLVSSDTDRRNDPDENGYLWWKSTYRFTFPANSALPFTVFRQTAAIVSSNNSVSSAAGPVSSGPASASMLLGPNGEQAPFGVDMSIEHFDVVWEFTEYVFPEFSGVVRARVMDGRSVVLSETDHAWVLRPANFSNFSDSAKGWMPISNMEFPRTSPATNRTKIGVGSIGFPTTEVDFDESFQADSMDISVPFVGVQSNTVSATFGLDSTTSSETINCAQFMLGHTEWQIAFDPPIPKQARHLFNMSVTISVTDRG